MRAGGTVVELVRPGWRAPRELADRVVLAPDGVTISIDGRSRRLTADELAGAEVLRVPDDHRWYHLLDRTGATTAVLADHLWRLPLAATWPRCSRRSGVQSGPAPGDPTVVPVERVVAAAGPPTRMLAWLVGVGVVVAIMALSAGVAGAPSTRVGEFAGLAIRAYHRADGDTQRDVWTGASRRTWNLRTARGGEGSTIPSTSLRGSTRRSAGTLTRRTGAWVDELTAAVVPAVVCYRCAAGLAAILGALLAAFAGRASLSNGGGRREPGGLTRVEWAELGFPVWPGTALAVAVLLLPVLPPRASAGRSARCGTGRGAGPWRHRPRVPARGERGLAACVPRTGRAEQCDRAGRAEGAPGRHSRDRPWRSALQVLSSSASSAFARSGGPGA